MQLRIRELREARGMTQSDLAKLIGTTGVSVSRYEKEPTRINLPLMLQLTRALKCSMDDLVGTPRPVAKPVAALPYRGRDKVLTFDHDQAEALGGAASLQAIEIVDDAMTPALGVGDTCLIDTRVTTVVRDGIYALDLDGQTVVKRVSWNPLKRVLSITNDNPLYSALGEAQPDDVVIAGRVVWAGKHL